MAKRVTADGKTLTVAEWSLVTGIKPKTIYYRLQAGWPAPAAVGVDPSFQNRRYGKKIADHSHQGLGTKEYKSWAKMVERTTCTTSSDYPRWGGRGITICSSWRGPGGFERFLAHVGNAPSSTHQIDRIDNAQGYRPGNVRWATPKTQARNRRSNRQVTAFGKTKCIAEWAEETGIKAATISRRLRVGWNAERAVSSPPMSQDEISKTAAASRWGS